MWPRRIVATGLGLLRPAPFFRHQPFVFLQLGLVSEVAAAGPDGPFEVLLGHAGTLSRPISGGNSFCQFFRSVCPLQPLLQSVVALTKVKPAPRFIQFICP